MFLAQKLTPKALLGGIPTGSCVTWPVPICLTSLHSLLPSLALTLQNHCLYSHSLHVQALSLHLTFAFSLSLEQFPLIVIGVDAFLSPFRSPLKCVLLREFCGHPIHSHTPPIPARRSIKLSYFVSLIALTTILCYLAY